MQQNQHPSSSSSAASTRLSHPPSLVTYKHLRFVIMDAPSESNLHLYIRALEEYHVKDIVRVCEPTYSSDKLVQHGMKLHDLMFPDGDSPPLSVVDAWLDLVYEKFGNFDKNEKSPITKDSSESESIAVHCVAGLGRAPVLVAIALIEYGLSPLDSVAYIRERRRGAINNKQLKYLETYKRRQKDKSCSLM